MAQPVPNTPINTPIPTGIAAYDVDDGIVYTPGSCSYTAITTSGTTTVSTGPGIFYGVSVWVLATATAAVYALDGTNTIMGTNTATALGQVFAGSPSNIGIRCTTNLIVVTSGTASNSWNVLWD